MAKETLSIILPTYNERETICRLIQKIFEVVSSMILDVEIVVVDDSSPDGTAQTVRKSFSENPRVRLIQRQGERSLGLSVRDGILAAHQDLILIMDADFKHPPVDIPRLLAGMDRASLVSGSRFVRGGGMEKARLRYWVTRLFNFLCRKVLGLRVADLLSRFLLARRKDLVSLELDKIFAGHGDFAIRLHSIAKKKGWSVLEIPINSPQRWGGRSKTRFVKHAVQYFLTALKTRFFIK